MKTKTEEIKEIYYRFQVTRNSFCVDCKDIEPFAIHGIDKEGKLWKGHLCLCGCWQCLNCGKVYKPKKPDDKEYSWDCCR